MWWLVPLLTWDTFESPKNVLSMIDDLDKDVLWACPWGFILIVGRSCPLWMALCPRQWILDCIIVERVSWALASFHLSIHPPSHRSLFLTRDVCHVTNYFKSLPLGLPHSDEPWPATVSPINTFALKLLLQDVFNHSNRKRDWDTWYSALHIAGKRKWKHSGKMSGRRLLRHFLKTCQGPEIWTFSF